MNYMTEIKLFYDWLETHQLTPASIALWHGLMYIANRAGWNEQMCVPISRIESRTQLSRASIYRERKRLCQAGLLRYAEQDGRRSTLYNLIPFEGRFVSHIDTQRDTQIDEMSAVVSRDVSQIDTQDENIYRLNYTKHDKDRKSEKRDFEMWLADVDELWREILLQWLEYKRSRRESYKSELSVRKCLTRLRHLATDNIHLARQIVDRSIANNWAGLFALPSAPTPRGHPQLTERPQYGQRIGQILQTEDENKRQRCIDRLKNAGKR